MAATHEEERVLLVSGDDSGDEGSAPLSLVDRIMTPLAVLIIFTALNFVTYFDRGALAGAVSAVRTDRAIAAPDHRVSDARSGMLVSVFMVGFMCTCPLFASLGTRHSARSIIAVGMLVWAVACLLTGAAPNYWCLLLCRAAAGVGEAAFVGFTVTIIDNIAPPARRTLWIGVFYCTIPVGTAAGMVAGGVVGEMAAVAGLAAWRWVFWGEVMASLPVLLAVLCIPARYDTVRPAGVRVDPGQLDSVAVDASTGMSSEAVALLPATKALFTNVHYVFIVVGFSTYCFVVGAISVWAIPLLVQGPLHLGTAAAASTIGLTTAVAGIVGSLLGGAAVDRLGGSAGLGGAANCQLFNVTMIALCLPLGVAALYAHHLAVFLPCFALSVVCLFAVTAPVNAAILSVVPRWLRPYAMSYCVFVIHALGDFPSPTLAGLLSDVFDHGCPRHVAQQTCESHAGQSCYWVAGSDGGLTGHCVSTTQLRDALVVVFAVLAAAIPLWGIVYIRLKRESATAPVVYAHRD